MKQLSGVTRSFEGHPRSFQGHLRSFLMIFHLLFTHTWVYKFNSLISQKSCKNDLVSEYVYISIYIYIFLNGILTIFGTKNILYICTYELHPWMDIDTIKWCSVTSYDICQIWGVILFIVWGVVFEIFGPLWRHQATKSRLPMIQQSVKSNWLRTTVFKEAN